VQIAAAVPGSLVYLQPGESIRVRVPTEWPWSGTESRRFKVVIRPTYDGRLFPDVLSDFDGRVETLAPR
jgi:hypothetical protein